MCWEIWKRRSGEILVNFSTFWGKLIDDLQKSDCYGLNSERKQSLTSSHGSLACVLLLLAVFLILLVHFFSAKSILPYFSSSRGVATLDCESHSQAGSTRCALTCSSLHTCHSTHMEPPGLFMAAYTQFMAFWGRFEPSWRPPMAILGGKIDPNTLAQVCLDMFQS